MSFPVLWLYGPSGVGKTTTARAIYTRLSEEDVPVACVDLDQIALMYPAPRWVRPAHVAGVAAVFRAAGAGCLIVSGIGEDSAIVTECAAGIPGASLTVARLRVEPGVLRERFLARGWRPDLLEDALSDAAAYDEAGFGDLLVDGDAPLEEVARKSSVGWPGIVAGTGPVPAESEVDSGRAGIPVTWFTKDGPDLAPGGWTLFEGVRAKEPAAYVDLTQVGRCSAGDPAWILRRNLGVLRAGYARAGAARLVVAGTAEEIATVGGGQ
ncbi:hypothetical protein Afil01_47840 [Actinorhabdospora filicis]|uniref:ATPase AAA-type core domain-containing protein n=1 Tax=Actinorhabdospora filicis TaxID=1785913 RepID=A0A9W6SPX9_9ACTN|nr:AAA family ATPase [Actinorhabdospora filicis]GLZ79977.1 hypothetical protein Afil01_47840 [Actinorhabdospora filicis]